MIVNGSVLEDSGRFRGVVRGELMRLRFSSILLAGVVVSGLVSFITIYTFGLRDGNTPEVAWLVLPAESGRIIAVSCGATALLTIAEEFHFGTARTMVTQVLSRSELFQARIVSIPCVALVITCSAHVSAAIAIQLSVGAVFSPASLSAAIQLIPRLLVANAVYATVGFGLAFLVRDGIRALLIWLAYAFIVEDFAAFLQPEAPRWLPLWGATQLLRSSEPGFLAWDQFQVTSLLAVFVVLGLGYWRVTTTDL